MAANSFEKISNLKTNFILECSINLVWKSSQQNVRVPILSSQDFSRDNFFEIQQKLLLKSLRFSPSRHQNYAISILHNDEIVPIDNQQDFQFFIIFNTQAYPSKKIILQLNQPPQARSNSIHQHHEESRNPESLQTYTQFPIETKKQLQQLENHRQEHKQKQEQKLKDLKSEQKKHDLDQTPIIKKEKKTTVKQRFNFDAMGNIMPELLDEFKVNQPSDSVYVGKQEVACAFCRRLNIETEEIKQLGPIYGPFNFKQQPYYVHLMCAIWTPCVFLDSKTKKMKNLKKEIFRCNRSLCQSCSELGGGLGCFVQNCQNTYHFLCALDQDLDVRLDHQNHVLYCPNHTYIFDDQNDKNQEKSLDNSFEEEKGKLIDDADVYSDEDDDEEKWICQICDINQDDELILICDQCDKGYHMYCLIDKLEQVPEGLWFCDRCKSNSIINLESYQNDKIIDIN